MCNKHDDHRSQKNLSIKHFVIVSVVIVLLIYIFQKWLEAYYEQFIQLAFFSLIVVVFMIMKIFITQTNQLSEKEVIEILKECDHKSEEYIMSQQNIMAERLSGAIKHKTISYEEASQIDYQEFLKLHSYLENCFPLIHKMLQKTIINQYSLIFKWEGSDSLQKPYLLYAHMDVVPTPDLDRWIEDPFKGVIKDGYIWGRGTIDDKHMMMAWMETLELLLKEGFKPKRTIYISFGHDEEISGFQGAFEIRKYFLQTLGSNCFEFMLDEGLFIIDGVVPGLKKPVAMVCVAEKGYATFKLSVSVEPGHSSAPPKETAIGILAKAVNKLEDNPHRLHFNGVAKKFFNQLIPDMNIYFKFILTNLWFFQPLFTMFLAMNPKTATLVRTTTAVTVFHSGIKSNVLPGEAYALVNHRIHPNDTIQEIFEQNQKIINDSRVQIQLYGSQLPASKVSSDQHQAFKNIRASVIQTFKGQCTVVPGLFIAASDSRHFWELAPQIYRFAPVTLKSDETKMFHGYNEKISIKNYAQIVLFCKSMILKTDQTISLIYSSRKI